MSFDLEQIQNALAAAVKSDAKQKELRRIVARAKSALDNVGEIFAELETILADDYTPAEKKTRSPRAPKEVGEVDPTAPYGRKLDGTAKAKPGRANPVA